MTLSSMLEGASAPRYTDVTDATNTDESGKTYSFAVGTDGNVNDIQTIGNYKYNLKVIFFSKEKSKTYSKFPDGSALGSQTICGCI